MGRSKVTFKVVDRDKGLKALTRKMKRAQKGATTVTVGLHGEKGPAEYGAFHEFGTVDLPQRSFLRATFDAKQKEYQNRLDEGARRVIDGETNFARVLFGVGMLLSNDVKKAITKLGLIDTGALRNAIALRYEKLRSGQ